MHRLQVGLPGRPSESLSLWNVSADDATPDAFTHSSCMAYDVQYVTDANDGTGEQKSDIDNNDEVDEETKPTGGSEDHLMMSRT